ncbi:MAG: ATP-dependent metallopeptidase FtsH/Yme1/Tma family protein, partial [Candidatus Paceibacterota bacterium]
MEKKPKNKKTDKKKGKTSKNTLGNNLFGTIIVFIILLSIYSLISVETQTPAKVSLSDVATDISAGKISSIEVNGGDLAITYVDKTKKTAKKEIENSLSTSLVNYGVSKEALDKVNIKVADEGGFAYWFVTLAPFLAPLL